MSTMTAATFITPDARRLIAEAQQTTRRLAVVASILRGHLRERELPETAEAFDQWMRQHELVLLWSRLGATRGVADDAQAALGEAEDVTARVQVMLDTLAKPIDGADFNALRAREQAATDAGALRAVATPLADVVSEVDTLAPLHRDYIAQSVGVALIGTRDLRQQHIDRIMREARERISAVLASRDEHADLQRWAAQHGVVVALTPLDERR